MQIFSHMLRCVVNVSIVFIMLYGQSVQCAVQASSELLERVPAGAHLEVSPSGTFRAYYVRIGTGADIYINGKLEAHSDTLFRDDACEEYGHITFQFSCDGAHYAYAIQRGEKTVLLVDGKEVPGDLSQDQWRLSPLGTHYWSRLNHAIMVDGQRYPGEVESDGVVFSPDDREWAVTLSDEEHGSATLLRNGTPVLTADGFSLVAFLPDGRLSWTTMSRPEHTDEWDVTGWQDDIYIGGTHLATIDWDVVPTEATVTSDGRHIAFVLLGDPAGDQRSTIMLDGKQSRVYPGEIERLQLSPAGDHLALFHRNDPPREYRVIYNHLVGPAFKDLRLVSFSPSGKHYAYFGEVQDDQYVFMADGQRVQAIPGNSWPVAIYWDTAERPVPVYLSRDQHYISIGNRIYGPYPAIAPYNVSVTSTGKLIYYSGLMGKNMSVFYIDGQPVSEISFTSLYERHIVDGQYVAVVGRRDGEGEQLLRVCLKIQ